MLHAPDGVLSAGDAHSARDEIADLAAVETFLRKFPLDPLGDFFVFCAIHHIFLFVLLQEVHEDGRRLFVIKRIISDRNVDP